MKTVGIVANPASGKDVRRLVARASVFDNQEKQAIVKRALAGIFAVPAQGVIAGVSHPVAERSHCFAQNIVDGHRYPRAVCGRSNRICVSGLKGFG